MSSGGFSHGQDVQIQDMLITYKVCKRETPNKMHYTERKLSESSSSRSGSAARTARHRAKRRVAEVTLTKTPVTASRGLLFLCHARTMGSAMQTVTEDGRRWQQDQIRRDRSYW
jgi:hypothetical protein